MGEQAFWRLRELGSLNAVRHIWRAVFCALSFVSVVRSSPYPLWETVKYNKSVSSDLALDCASLTEVTGSGQTVCGTLTLPSNAHDFLPGSYDTLILTPHQASGLLSAVFAWILFSIRV